jgi:hypothetical protein
MISLLCPTRGRPAQCRRLIDSVHATVSDASGEIIFYQDDDDPLAFLAPHMIRGPRVSLGAMFNSCASIARGEILMMMGDDCVFRTPGWAGMVEQAFAESRDKVLMVHGDDLVPHNKGRFGVFPTIHRRWLDATGYFVPPQFVGDFADNWLNDIADALGRRRALPFIQEHLHVAWGKAPEDDTYREKWARDKAIDAERLYREMKPQRDADVEKLRKVMKSV